MPVAPHDLGHGSVHQALARAREARKPGGGRKHEALEIAPPNVLYGLANGDREIYRHAMIEAGHIVGDTDEPYNPCPVCGFEF